VRRYHHQQARLNRAGRVQRATDYRRSIAFSSRSGRKTPCRARLGFWKRRIDALYHIISRRPLKATNQYLARSGCAMGGMVHDTEWDRPLSMTICGTRGGYRRFVVLKRPSGRRLPGDVFYLHSRYSNARPLSDEYGGGSVTALPISKAGGTLRYIRECDFSITDGQSISRLISFIRSAPAISVACRQPCRFC